MININNNDNKLRLLKDLSIKSFENAEELYIEANILYKNKKYSRAFFLTQIGGEELGKHVVCTGGIVNYIVGTFEISNFKKRFLNHKKKTMEIDIFESFLLSNIERIKSDSIEEDTKLLEKLKMMGLYCDYEKDYAFKPSEIFNKSTVEIAINLLKKRLDFIRNIGLVDLLKNSEEMPTDKIKEIYEKYKN